MPIFLSFTLILVFTILIIFSFPQFSPIPYFPSNKKDINLIFKALDLKNNQTIIDLGAGGGWVIFEAAKKAYQKKLNTKFIAVEINPILIMTLYLKRFCHKNKKNIQIVRDDIFTLKSVMRNPQLNNQAIIFYLYISPWFLKKVINQIKKTLKKFTVVSYFYEIKDEKCAKKLSGTNNIYLYELGQINRGG